MTTSNSPTAKARKVLFATCLGGSVVERLAQALEKVATASDVCHQYSAAEWRAGMRAGSYARAKTRLKSFLAFPAHTLLQTMRQVPDVVVSTTNPFILPVILTASKALHQRPVIVLVYDLYPDALEVIGVTHPEAKLSRLLAATTRFWMKHADGVVFIGDQMATYAQERYGTPRRSAVIHTGADEDEFTSGDLEPESELERWCQNKTIVSYVGNLGRMHEWETIAAAAPLLMQSSPDEKPIGLVIAASGPGVDALKRTLSHLTDDRIRFVPPLDDRAWARLLMLSDVSLVTLRDAAAHTSVPSKTFSAMAAGCAVVAVAPKTSDLASLIEQTKCGVVVAPGDVDGLVAGVQAWVNQPERLIEAKAAATRAIHEYFGLDVLANHWTQLIDDVIQDSQSPDRSNRTLLRTMDIVGAGAGLAMTWPLMLGSAAAVKLTMGGPVLFRQQRAGRAGEPFELLKFRSMRNARPGEEAPEHDHKRMTRLGRFLRETSLDELPTLWNVLRGEMSLVGPRPLLLQYTERYSARQRKRLDVKPGVTGWAQVNGRNGLAWADKLELDAWYVDHKSLWLDLRIMLKTVAQVAAKSGIHADGHATMPEFMGDDE